MKPLAILDTETTSLRRDRRAWEIAVIRIDQSGEHEFSVHVGDVDLANADPASLHIGRFYERHPLYSRSSGDSDHGPHMMTEAAAAKHVEQWTRGAHIVGAVPSFDTEVLADMLYRHRLVPAWHYHLIDVEVLVAGYLSGLVDAARMEIDESAQEPALSPPWKSETLSRAVGVDPDKFARHTALGDCRWVLAQLRAVAPGLIAAAMEADRG